MWHLDVRHGATSTINLAEQPHRRRCARGSGNPQTCPLRDRGCDGCTFSLVRGEWGQPARHHHPPQRTYFLLIASFASRANCWKRPTRYAPMTRATSIHCGFTAPPLLRYQGAGRTSSQCVAGKSNDPKSPLFVIGFKARLGAHLGPGGERQVERQVLDQARGQPIRVRAR